MSNTGENNLPCRRTKEKPTSHVVENLCQSSVRINGHNGYQADIQFQILSEALQLEPVYKILPR